MEKSRISDYDVNLCEIYLHRLRHFLALSEEGDQLELETRKQIIREINEMEFFIEAYDNMMNGRGSKVGAWRHEITEEAEDDVIIERTIFGSKTVASAICGVAEEDVLKVIQGKKYTAKGFRFMEVPFDSGWYLRPSKANKK